uniref:Uncharacterized protein n=1 Tax=Haemonchus contortus TaxID=6289 RepID=W6NFM5_HAECO
MLLHVETSLTGKESGDQAVEPSVNEKNHELNRLSLIQIVIFFQFTIAAALTIFAVVGVSVNQPIGFILLLALLQFLITVPGFAYYFTRKPAHFFAYLLLQAITGGSEVIWFIYSVITDTYTVIHLLILILLICVQTVALLAATILKHVHINLNDEASTRVEARRGRRRRGSSKSSGSGSAKRGRRVSRDSSQEEGTSKVGEFSSPSSPPRKRFSRDLEQGPDKSIRSTGRRKILGDSMLNVKEGRRKILELAQQLRDRQMLGRRHSDPSLNAQNDEKSEKSMRKSKSTESNSQDRRFAAETLSTPITSGQQSPFQNPTSTATNTAEPFPVYSGRAGSGSSLPTTPKENVMSTQSLPPASETAKAFINSDPPAPVEAKESSDQKQMQ